MGTPRPPRDEYSEATRRALVTGAVRLFTERGYAGASLDALAAEADVTKGALYHHFGGKQAVFVAAVESVQADVAVRLRDAVHRGDDPWQRAVQGLRTYLQICLEPGYQRLVMLEGPAVLGVRSWQQHEEGYALGIIAAVLADLVADGAIDDLPARELTVIVVGALGRGAQAIGAAEDPDAVGERVRQVVERLLDGLRPR